jgi:glutaminyl-tRNA synthetase
VEVVKDDAGEVVELRCEYIPESRSGEDTSGLKVKGTIHWLSAPHAIAAELRMYDRLFTVPEPDDDKERDYKELLNPNSLQVIKDAFVEPSLAQVKPLTHLQFERKGYFCADEETKADKPVFNLTVNLRDTWAKVVDKA